MIAASTATSGLAPEGIADEVIVFNVASEIADQGTDGAGASDVASAAVATSAASSLSTADAAR